MKKVIGVVTAATLIVTLVASPALAEDNGGYGNIPSNASKILSKKDGYYRVSLDEKGQGAHHSSMFVQVSNRYEFGDWEMCTDIDQGFCRGSDSKRVGGSSILPICTTKIENCVSSVRIYKEGEEPTAAVFKGNIPGYQTKSKPSIGLPEGSTIALFDSPTTPHTSGSEYALSASITWDKPPGGKFNPYSFDIRVAQQNRYQFLELNQLDQIIVLHLTVNRKLAEKAFAQWPLVVDASTISPTVVATIRNSARTQELESL